MKSFLIFWAWCTPLLLIVAACFGLGIAILLYGLLLLFRSYRAEYLEMAARHKWKP